MDLAACYSLGRAVRLQANVENVFGEEYFVNADNNNNITPGYPRALRVGVATTF